MTANDRRTDLNLFRVLDAIHTHGGISAAARALHLTQPAITHSLNRLREMFGDPLFVRHGNRMLPTHRARSVMADVQLHLRGLQATTQTHTRFSADELRMSFSVGFRDVLESIAFPPLMTQIEKQAPHIQVLSRRISTTDVERELSAGNVDLVIDRRLHTDNRLCSQQLMDEHLMVAMRHDHPLAATDTLRRADYLAANHVAVSQLGEAVPLDILLAQDGRSRDIRLLCQHYFSACQVAASSDLLLTMPSSYARHFSQLLPVSVKPLPIKLKPIPILAYWHPSRETDRAHQWFRELVIKTVSGTVEFAEKKGDKPAAPRS